MVAGELVFAVGHEGGLVWPGITDETHQVLCRVALDVEFALGPVAHQCRQIRHVTGADMALIRTGMDGDAVGPRLQAQRGCARDTGNAQMACVAQQGNLVHIDRQTRLARLTHSFCSSNII